MIYLSLNQQSFSMKVTAEVFAPGSKKSILKVDGEWNGKLMAKYATGK